MSACIIVLVNYACKKSIVIGAVLASIPLVSVLAITLNYLDNKNTKQIAELSASIGWMVLPSLVFFIALPLCLKYKISFVGSMVISITATSVAYAALIVILRKLGIQF